jgi:hypothetical protein
MDISVNPMKNLEISRKRSPPSAILLLKDIAAAIVKFVVLFL